MKYLFYLLSLFSLSSFAWVLPQQIHLSWTERPNEMRVTWVTYYALSSTVAYRELLCPNSSDSGNFKYIQGSYKIFNEGEKYDRFQNIHTAVITGIRPVCFYEYYVLNWIFSSETFVFSGRTPDTKSASDLDKPVRMIVFGDWGIGALGQYTNHLLGEEAKMRNFDAILHIGDVAYDLEHRDGEVGDEYLRMIQHIAAEYPYMIIPGNHENFNNFTHLKERFHMPVNEANQGTNSCFSFDIGRAHFVMFSTEVFFNNRTDEAQVMLNWLSQDLKEANERRKERPWLILGTHHPLYCSVDWSRPMEVQSNNDCGVDTILLQELLEDIFIENSVDIFFGAHVHNYERDSPIYRNKTVPSDFDDMHTHINAKAPLHIVAGNAGNDHSHNDPTSHTPQDWAKVWSNDYGYGRVIVYNSTHVYWEQYSGLDKNVIDYVWVIKNHTKY
jgi:hypothetical protein